MYWILIQFNTPERDLQGILQISASFRLAIHRVVRVESAAIVRGNLSEIVFKMKLCAASRAEGKGFNIKTSESSKTEDGGFEMKRPSVKVGGFKKKTPSSTKVKDGGKVKSESTKNVEPGARRMAAPRSSGRNKIGAQKESNPVGFPIVKKPRSGRRAILRENLPSTNGRMDGADDQQAGDIDPPPEGVRPPLEVVKNRTAVKKGDIATMKFGDKYWHHTVEEDGVLELCVERKEELKEAVNAEFNAPDQHDASTSSKLGRRRIDKIPDPLACVDNIGEERDAAKTLLLLALPKEEAPEPRVFSR